MTYEAAIRGFAAVFALMALRVPIGIALGVVGYAVVVGPKPAMRLLALSPLRTASDLNFAVVPLFIVMGVLARNAGISADLFTAFRTWFAAGWVWPASGPVRGFRPSPARPVATAATMAKIAVPEMTRAGYDDRYAAATVPQAARWAS